MQYDSYYRSVAERAVTGSTLVVNFVALYNTVREGGLHPVNSEGAAADGSYTER